MRLILIFSLLTSYLSSQAQLFNFGGQFSPDTTEICIKQKEKAYKDFSNGDYELPLKKSTPLFSSTYSKVLFEEYSIKSKYVDMFIEDCYNYYLKEAIKDKLGKNILTEAQEKADSIDENGGGTRQEKLNTRHNNLYIYVIDNITIKEEEKLKKKYGKGYLRVKVTIDPQGVVKVDGMSHDQQACDEPIVRKTLEGKKLFLPKTENGKAIETFQIHPMRFIN